MSKMLLEAYMPSRSPQLTHCVFHAGAGSGKTSWLIEQITKELLQAITQNKKPSIIVTTFTKKASGEVKERIMTKAIETKNWKLLTSISDPSQVLISTIDGIFYHFLKKHHPKWPSKLNLINEYQQKMAARSILRKLFEDSSFFPLLNHYKFSDIYDFLLSSCRQTIFKTQFTGMTKKEMIEQWKEKIKSAEANGFKTDPSLLSQILDENTNLEPIVDKIKTHWEQEKKNLKNFPKQKFEKLFKEHHPKHFQHLEEIYDIFSELCQKFHTQWNLFKKRTRQFQIEDIEAGMLDLIQSRGKSLSIESSQWFIDEYQDTNPVQEQILNTLTKNSSVWAAGDPQQSIYLFRKADPEVFQRKLKQAKKLKGSVEESRKNFRSSKELICFFNDLFKDKFHPIEKREASYTSSEEKELEKSSPPDVCFISYKEPVQYSTLIAHRLNQLLSQNIRPENICILLKTNQEALNLGHFLKQMKFPVQVHSKNILKKSCMDVLFFLRFLINPLDNYNLIGLLRSPYFYISDSDIAGESSKNSSLWMRLKQEYKNHPSVQSLKEFLKQSYKEGFSKTLSSFLENSLIIDLCHYQDPSEEQENSLWNLLFELKEKEKTPDFNYSRFIEEKMNAAQDLTLEGGSSSSSSKKLIQLMTIHQSKGLEFDHLIIPQIEKSISLPDSSRFVINSETKKWSFPIYNEQKESFYPVDHSNYKETLKQKQNKEQDRLFYVAVTRAKKTLSFLFSSDKMTKSPSWLNQFSYFENIQNHLQESKFKITQKEGYKIMTCLIESKEEENLLFSDQISNFQSQESISPLCKIQKNMKNQILKPYSSHTLLKQEDNFKKPPCTANVLKQGVRGVLLHSILQTLFYTQNIQKTLYQVPSEEHIEWKAALQYVLDLKTPPILQLFKKGFSEWDFSYLFKNQAIKGRIDLWGEIKDTVWIVDYKSSHVSKDSWKQMNMYALALNKKRPSKKIKMCIIQPFSKKCEIRSFHPSENS